MSSAWFVVAAALGLAACAPGMTGTGVSPTSAFERDPRSQPVISSGRAGLPTMAFDPGLFVDEEGYHLFYTTLFCRLPQGGWSYSWDPASPAACNIGATLGTIAYAFSGDRGRTWEFRLTPVVALADTGFDASKIETAYPFKLGDTLYLAYSAEGMRGGRRFAARYQIGVAHLALGRQSVRTALLGENRMFARRETPLLPWNTTAGRFDNNVQEPSIAITPDGPVLYFTGLGLRLPDQPVDAPGQAITSVGLGRAELDGALNVRSRSSAPLLERINITEVRYFDGAFHLFGTTLGGGGEFHRNERIAYARSEDGQSWPAPLVILQGSVPGFDNWGIMAPTVAVERDRLVLFYTAFGTQAGACFPVPADGRFGRPVSNNTECLFGTIGRAVSPRRRP